MWNIKIAVIDTDKKFTGKIEAIALMAGYVPLVVNDVRAAVDAVIQSKPDVILLGLKMPEKNGFELAVALDRALGTREIPIIAVSDFFNQEFVWLMELCGIKKWFKKPCQPLDFIWAVESGIEEDSQWSRENYLVDAASFQG
jgi:two-component system chemotaxis response regulator CheY